MAKGNKNTKIIIFEIIACVILVAISVAIFNSVQNSAQSFATEYSENEKKIADLQEQYTLLSQNGSVTVTTVKVTMKSAADRGKNVAYLQNNYKNLDIVEDEDAYLENADTLDSFFADDSKNARVRWYSPDENLTDEDGNPLNVSYSWTFESRYNFTGDGIDVVWLCRDTETNDLLAYTLAKFDVATNEFSNVKRVITKLGASYIGYTDDIATTSSSSSSTSSVTKTTATNRDNSSKAAMQSRVNSLVNELSDYNSRHGVTANSVTERYVVDSDTEIDYEAIEDLVRSKTTSSKKTSTEKED